MRTQLRISCRGIQDFIEPCAIFPCEVFAEPTCLVFGLVLLREEAEGERDVPTWLARQLSDQVYHSLPPGRLSLFGRLVASPSGSPALRQFAYSQVPIETSAPLSPHIRDLRDRLVVVLRDPFAFFPCPLMPGHTGLVKPACQGGPLHFLVVRGWIHLARDQRRGEVSGKGGGCHVVMSLWLWY